jgi:hypothetical protein
VDLPDARRVAGRHEVRPRLGSRVHDRPQDVEQVCLLLVDRHAVARDRGRRRDELGERQAAVALRRGGGAGHRPVRSRRGRADVEHLHGVAEVDVDREQRRVRSAGREPAPGRLDEEVEQHRVLARRRDEHVAAGAEAGEHRLGDERREHRRQRGVHGVAAGAERVRAGFGGDRMAGGDDAAHDAGRQSLGMYSGTSTSMLLRSRRDDGRLMRLTRGSPDGSRSPGARSSVRAGRFSP